MRTVLHTINVQYYVLRCVSGSCNVRPFPNRYISSACGSTPVCREFSILQFIVQDSKLKYPIRCSGIGPGNYNMTISLIWLYPGRYC